MSNKLEIREFEVFKGGVVKFDDLTSLKNKQYALENRWELLEKEVQDLRNRSYLGGSSRSKII